MHIIAINGSRRKKNTYYILKQIEKTLTAINCNITVEYINLYDYDISYCNGCEICITKDICHINDDMEILMNKLNYCDGIIISSPVYMMQLSGKLKTFIDRTCKWFHRPELVGKPILCVCTTQGSGLKDTLKYLNTVAIEWGAAPCGTIGKNHFTISKPLTNKDIKIIKNFASFKKHQYSPTYFQLIIFQVQKVLALYLLENDKEYWHKKGYDKSNYFFKAKISKSKILVSNMFYKLLNNKMDKSKN